jgi:hypothetical protein
MALEPTTDVVATGASPWGLWEEPEAPTLICGECASEMPPEAAFCGECGVRLERPVDEVVSTEPDADVVGTDVDPAAPPDVDFAEPVDVYPTPPSETADLLPVLPPSTAGKRRRRRRAPVLVGIAAAAVLVGVILSSGGSDNEDSVIAADVSTTITTKDLGESDTDEASGTDTTDSEAPAPGDESAVATDDTATTATTAGGGDINAAGARSAASNEPAFSDAAPAQSNAAPQPPAPPPPKSTTTTPPPPAALSASSSCSPSCVVPRGGRFEILVTNSGGRSGTFRATASEGLQVSPGEGSVAPGQSRTIIIVDTLGKRRPGSTVEVRGPNGAVIFTATFDIRG